MKLFQTHESLRKKQLLEELTNKGLTSDVKVVSTILKVSVLIRVWNAVDIVCFSSEKYSFLAPTQELCYSKGGHSGLWRLLGT